MARYFSRQCDLIMAVNINDLMAAERRYFTSCSSFYLGFMLFFQCFLCGFRFPQWFPSPAISLRTLLPGLTLMHLWSLSSWILRMDSVIHYDSMYHFPLCMFYRILPATPVTEPTNSHTIEHSKHAFQLEIELTILININNDYRMRPLSLSGLNFNCQWPPLCALPVGLHLCQKVMLNWSWFDS